LEDEMMVGVLPAVMMRIFVALIVQIGLTIQVDVTMMMTMMKGIITRKMNQYVVDSVVRYVLSVRPGDYVWYLIGKGDVWDLNGNVVLSTLPWGCGYDHE